MARAPAVTIVTLSCGFGRDPGVAWNSVTNEFGVSFSGETATTVYSAFAKVPADQSRSVLAYVV